MIKRSITHSNNNSFFLFGARGTGKTWWLKSIFRNTANLWIDLLDLEEEEKYSSNPNLLLEVIDLEEKIEWVIIDEVQKIPKLLDLVHKLIESSDIKFALTGSSARKLKRGGANLLAGRAFVFHSYPLTYQELDKNFSLDDALNWGTLPKLLEFSDDKDKARYLRSYALTYLKEEIKEEQIVRKIDPFRKFLEISAQMNGKIINFSSIARSVNVDTKTVQEYYSILEETLLGFKLEPFHKSIRKRQLTNPKFYLFDIGVKKALDKTLTIQTTPKTSAYGEAFEHFIIAEINRLIHYKELDWSLFYLTTKDGAEIDLIIERPGLPIALIEIKSTTKIEVEHLKHLKGFKDSFESKELYCFSNDKKNRVVDAVSVLFWKDGIEAIGL